MGKKYGLSELLLLAIAIEGFYLVAHFYLGWT